MRLIDADALKTKIEQSGGEGTIARYCKRVLAECLDNDAPTIDAIPVAWLIQKMTEVESQAEPHFAYRYVLHEWKDAKPIEELQAESEMRDYAAEQEDGYAFD